MRVLGVRVRVEREMGVSPRFRVGVLRRFKRVWAS